MQLYQRTLRLGQDVNFNRIMHSEESSIAKPVTTELKRLYSLLKITEGQFYAELLFSFPLPPEVVKKYEEMKDASFVQAGLTYSPSRMWKQQ
jgi:hypothetical protein